MIGTIAERQLFFRQNISSGLMGIYIIVNRINGHRYVGQSRDMRSRRAQHYSDLFKNRHGNRYLQNSVNLYTIKVFQFIVLEVTQHRWELNKLEQKWIDDLKPEYNSMLEVTAPIFFYTQRDLDELPIIRLDEHFRRPEWHSWVYGGCKKPTKYARKEIVYYENHIENVWAMQPNNPGFECNFT